MDGVPCGIRSHSLPSLQSDRVPSRLPHPEGQRHTQEPATAIGVNVSTAHGLGDLGSFKWLSMFQIWKFLVIIVANIYMVCIKCQALSLALLHTRSSQCLYC